MLLLLLSELVSSEDLHAHIDEHFFSLFALLSCHISILCLLVVFVYLIVISAFLLRFWWRALWRWQ